MNNDSTKQNSSNLPIEERKQLKKPGIVLFYEFAIHPKAPIDTSNQLLGELFAQSYARGYRAALAQPYKIVGQKKTHEQEYTPLEVPKSNPTATYYVRRPADNIGVHEEYDERTIDGVDYQLMKQLNWYKLLPKE